MFLQKLGSEESSSDLENSKDDNIYFNDTESLLTIFDVTTHKVCTSPTKE